MDSGFEAIGQGQWPRPGMTEHMIRTSEALNYDDGLFADDIPGRERLTRARQHVCYGGSLVQRLALDRAAAKQPALVVGEIGSCMDRTAVVPHQEIVELPDVLEDEFAPLADFV